MGFVFLIAVSALAHKGEHHGDQKKEEEPVDASSLEAKLLQKLNEEYVANVKPIFQRSCMNCHSTNVDYPWYHILPGAKQLIDYDVTEAKVHLDMTKDFPFGGHGTPLEDLEAIQSSLEKGTMPPFRYRAMHWSSRIGTDDLGTIQTWIKTGLAELRSLKTK